MKSLDKAVREFGGNQTQVTHPFSNISKEYRIAIMAQRWQDGRDIWTGRELSPDEKIEPTEPLTCSRDGLQ